MNKLILGTAQFGSDYGIKRDGQPSIKEIEKIARIAWDAGIRTVHSSWQYAIDRAVKKVFKDFDWIIKDLARPELFSWKALKGKAFYDPSSVNGSYHIIQVPVNVLDTRFMEMARSFWGIVIARSVFLQGLLLMDEIPSWVGREGKTMISSFQIVCKSEGLEYYEAALGWVLGLKDIDWVLVGVNSAKQMEQLTRVKSLTWDYDFSITDENVIDPRRWPKS